jgi:hypothetical protein
MMIIRRSQGAFNRMTACAMSSTAPIRQAGYPGTEAREVTGLALLAEVIPGPVSITPEGEGVDPDRGQLKGQRARQGVRGSVGDGHAHGVDRDLGGDAANEAKLTYGLSAAPGRVHQLTRVFPCGCDRPMRHANARGGLDRQHILRGASPRVHTRRGEDHRESVNLKEETCRTGS